MLKKMGARMDSCGTPKSAFKMLLILESYLCKMTTTSYQNLTFSLRKPLETYLENNLTYFTTFWRFSEYFKCSSKC